MNIFTSNTLNGCYGRQYKGIIDEKEKYILGCIARGIFILCGVHDIFHDLKCKLKLTKALHMTEYNLTADLIDVVIMC